MFFVDTSPVEPSESLLMCSWLVFAASELCFANKFLLPNARRDMIVQHLVQDIVGDNSIRNRKPLTRQYNLTRLSSALSASKVKLRFEAFNVVHSRKSERKEWCMTLASILDWIGQFNQDVGRRQDEFGSN